MKSKSGNFCSSSLIPASRASQVTSTSMGGRLICCRKASRQPSRWRVSACSEVSLTTVTTTVSIGAAAMTSLPRLHQRLPRTKGVAHPLPDHVDHHGWNEQRQAEYEFVHMTLSCEHARCHAGQQQEGD